MQLYNLSLEIYSHSATISEHKPKRVIETQGQSILDSFGRSSLAPGCSVESDDSKADTPAIDKTFLFSLSLIEILYKLYPRYYTSPPQGFSISRARSSSPSPYLRFSGQSSPILQSTPSSSSHSYSSTAAEQISRSSSTSPIMDQGSVLLLLSCYLQLVELYDKLFTYIQASIKHSGMMPQSEHVQLPPIHVGLFSTQPSSVLHNVLVVHLAMQFLERMREITSQIGIAQK